ncbi:MAG: TonB-dependent receptor domain-containing protein [Rubricoccaceae bacterium]
MSLLRLLSLLLFLAPAWAVLPAAAQAPGTLAGRVTDATGQPLPGVNVRLEGTALGAASGVDGRFALAAVPAGRYTLVATSVGFAPERRVLELRGGEAVAVALVLREAALDAGEVVVTARETLTGRGTRDVPGTAYYVGRRTLERFAYSDLHRVLREVPGVQVQEEEGYGLRPNIGIRGTGSQRSSKITLMEDGVLIAPAPYAAPAAYYVPTIGRMDGLELRAGASQIKYGPYTTGGALNLIAADVPAALEVRADARAGSNGQRLLHARVGDAVPAVRALGGLGAGFVVEGRTDRVDGFKTVVGPGGVALAPRTPTGYDKTDLFGRLRLSTPAGARVAQALTLTAGYADETSDETYLGLTAADFAAAPFVRYAGSQLDQMNTDHRALRARHVAVFSSRADLTTTLYRNTFSRNWYRLNAVNSGLTGAGNVGIASILNEPERFAAEYALVRGNGPATGRLIVNANARTYYSEGAQSVLGVRLGSEGGPRALVEAGLRLHADAEDRFQWADRYAIEDGVMTRVQEGVPGTTANRVDDARARSAFVQAEVVYGPFTLTPGLRYETVRFERRDFGAGDLERTGASVQVRENEASAWIPGLSVLYRVGGGAQVFGGVHRGFAPPNSTPETRPESSLNVEGGARYAAGAFEAQAVVYRNAYSNLLGSDLAAAGGTATGDLFNAGAVNVTGAEVALRADLAEPAGLAGWAFPVRLAYTLTEARFQTSFQSTLGDWGRVQAGDELPYTPRHQLGARLGAERGRAALSLGTSAVSAARARAGQGPVPEAERIGARLVLDAAGEVGVQYGVSLFGRVQNLTNATYVAARQPAGLRPGLPRTFDLGLRARL